MKIYTNLLKCTTLICLMILISSSVYGQSEKMKRDIIQLQEEISLNQDNASYDLESAKSELQGLVDQYISSGDAVKADTKVVPQKQSTNTSVIDLSATDPGKASELVAEYKEFIEKVKLEKVRAQEAGKDVSKYNKYIEEYNELLRISKTK